MRQAMLAGTIKNVEDLRFPILASPKLDGIRAIIDTNGKVMSRNGKEIPNKHVQDQLGFSHLYGLDGELICGDPTAPDAYRKTTSAVMSVDGEPEVTYHVFDVQAIRDYGFQDRLAKAKTIINDVVRGPRIKLVQHLTIKTVDELLRYEEVCLVKGYEGVMIRDPRGPYKHGRSTLKEGWLLKLKRFRDSEATVIGAVELRHNKNEATRNELGKLERSSAKAGKIAGGILGALVVRDCVTGVEFEIGTGFTREQRVELWQKAQLGGLTDKMLTYKYFPTGSKDRPRFPVFVGWRHDLNVKER
jgi:DNA ligase 1